MAISRRDALKSLAVVPLATGVRVQADDDSLRAIASVVLPAEADQTAALRAFTDWIAGYREGADTDHGYGNTRIRPTGPSPARNYQAQLDALNAAAQAKGSASFAAAPPPLRRALIESAIADANIERLPARPAGGHIAVDLMGHYFNSPAGNDLCYRAAIARDACRGLPGSENAPTPLPSPGRRR